MQSMTLEIECTRRFDKATDALSAAKALAERALHIKSQMDEVPPTIFAFAKDKLLLVDARKFFVSEGGKELAAVFMRRLAHADSTVEGVAVACECYAKTAQGPDSVHGSLKDDPAALEAILISVEWENGPNCVYVAPFVSRDENGATVIEFGEPMVHLDSEEDGRIESRFSEHSRTKS